MWIIVNQVTDNIQLLQQTATESFTYRLEKMQKMHNLMKNMPTKCRWQIPK